MFPNKQEEMSFGIFVKEKKKMKKMLDRLLFSMLYQTGYGSGLFFMPKNRLNKIITEVEVVRVKITLACTECKQRNYNTTKEKKNHPDRMETKKYCRFCKSHTLHKETK